MTEENKEGADETRIEIEVAGEKRAFTPEELQQHVQESMKAEQREAEITAREARLNSMAEKARMMETWEGMIRENPDQAVQQLYSAIGRDAPPAAGAAEEDPLEEIDDEDLSPAAKQALRAVQRELQELKARDQTRAEERAQEMAMRELDSIMDRFPQYEGENRDTLKQMIAVMSSQAPSVPLDQIAEQASSSIHKLVQSQTQKAKDEREEREEQRQVPPGAGTPPLTPPAEPMTHKDMKQGRIRDLLADSLRKHAGFK